MTIKYFKGRIPKHSSFEAIDESLHEKAVQVVKKVDTHMGEVAFQKSLDSIWELIAMTNKYIDESAPWSLAKDTNKQKRLATVIYSVLESLRFIAILLFPFIPSSAEKMWGALGMKERIDQQRLDNIKKLDMLKEGTVVTKIPPLFPRIEN